MRIVLVVAVLLLGSSQLRAGGKSKVPRLNAEASGKVFRGLAVSEKQRKLNELADEVLPAIKPYLPTDWQGVTKIDPIKVVSHAEMHAHFKEMLRKANQGLILSSKEKFRLNRDLYWSSWLMSYLADGVHVSGQKTIFWPEHKLEGESLSQVRLTLAHEGTHGFQNQFLPRQMERFLQEGNQANVDVSSAAHRDLRRLHLAIEWQASYVAERYRAQNPTQVSDRISTKAALKDIFPYIGIFIAEPKAAIRQGMAYTLYPHDESPDYFLRLLEDPTFRDAEMDRFNREQRVSKRPD